MAGATVAFWAGIGLFLVDLQVMESRLPSFWYFWILTPGALALFGFLAVERVGAPRTFYLTFVTMAGWLVAGGMHSSLAEEGFTGLGVGAPDGISVLLFLFYLAVFHIPVATGAAVATLARRRNAT